MRRRLLAIALSASALAVALPACSPYNPPVDTPTPTSTPVPPGSVTLAGRVTDAELGTGIEGATVSVRMSCVPRSFQATSDSAGHYSVVVPADYLNACGGGTFEAYRGDYDVLSVPLTADEMRAQPERDVSLKALRPGVRP